MTEIRPGRVMQHYDHDIVVFLIGTRINKPWKVGAWLPVTRAMPRMLRELEADPGSGFLGARMAIEGRGALLVQYWASTEQLLAYAHDRDREHRPAWSAFNRAARTSGGAVGIWHETYRVPAGAFESIYVDMPPLGLPAVTETVPVGSRSDSARQRLAG